jgi:DNA (cytosine-5)-methyltransferase 1
MILGRLSHPTCLGNHLHQPAGWPMSTSTTKRYMIDLFAGCGGLSLGMEQAGFTPLLFSEINRHAAETYKENRAGQSIEECPDVSELVKTIDARVAVWRGQGIKDIDLVCGGPPCQGYSGIGHRRSFEVEREAVPSNHLYLEMINVIEAVQPKVFLFENVRGLLSGRWTKTGEKGEIFKSVWAAFSKIDGYRVRWALVQAKHYGVPQNRPRLLIVGLRTGEAAQHLDPDSPEANALRSGFLPERSGQAPDLSEVFGDLVDPNYRATGRTSTYPLPALRGGFQEEMRTAPDGQLLPKGAPVTEHEYSNHSDDIVKKFRYMIDNGGAIPARMKTKKFAQRVLPEHWGEEGPNITATSLPDDFVHYSQPRSLTVREWARLQCFPDWYQFKGPRTTGGHRRAGRPDQNIWERDVPRYTQIGNAVPVRLAKAVGTHFVANLLSQAAPRLEVATSRKGSKPESKLKASGTATSTPRSKARAPAQAKRPKRKG